jgi:transcriptional regulator GlxA family with amidase domain
MDARVKRVIELFNREFTGKISEEMISKQVNLSPARLRQVFKKETGFSPIRYLKRLRMSMAARLLKSSFLSVKEIAFQTGSGDTSHFVRDFKKHYAVTPSQFRLGREGSPKKSQYGGKVSD